MQHSNQGWLNNYYILRFVLNFVLHTKFHTVLSNMQSFLFSLFILSLQSFSNITHNRKTYFAVDKSCFFMISTHSLIWWRLYIDRYCIKSCLKCVSLSPLWPFTAVESCVNIGLTHTLQQAQVFYPDFITSTGYFTVTTIQLPTD